MQRLVVAVLLGVVCVVGDGIPSQQPTIIPEGGNFEGTVRGGIALLSNEDRSTTRLYYTISACCDCDGWKRPDPKNAGIDKETRELKSVSERVHLTTSACITAVAVTENFEPSELSKATFKITDSLVKAPVITPSRGRYHGWATVSMEVEGVGNNVIHYTVDGDAPTDQSEKYRAPFNLTAHGKHYIRAVTVSGGVTSPVAERQIEIALPVKYQVVTDGCEKCKGATVGTPFVLMFQGFRPTPVNKVFVSPVPCKKGPHHMLAGCDCRDGIIPTNLTLKITTHDSPADHIYVCYTGNGGQSWSMVRNAATNELSFPLHPGVGEEGDTTSEQDKAGGLVEEATPQDWENYHHAKKRKTHKPVGTDALTPGVVVLVVLGTGLWFAFKRT